MPARKITGLQTRYRQGLKILKYQRISLESLCQGSISAVQGARKVVGVPW